MTEIAINLSDDQYQKLKHLASLHGITVEVLLKASLDDWLNGQKDDFANAADYVLNKNTELYKRLA